jgi:predicted ATPase/DNA-binding XRE family transcriptional regulator
MKPRLRSFGAQLKALREAAGYTQEELATIAGLSVHGVSALERGERRRPHVETVRALSAALDLTGTTHDAFLRSARAPADHTAADELTGASLPVPLTALLGRDTDLRTLRHWLGDPVIRLITLTGPGGAGKTRLALELAREMAEEGSARVILVSLAAVRGASFVAAAIAEALGFSDVAALDLPRCARIACRDQATLLVVDNFEHVLDAASLIADLLTSVPPLRVLVTSRASLRVRGEREYAVGPLELEAGSETMPTADLARVPAVQLFLERLRDVQPHFRLTAANGPIVTEICRRLDALPLAIELAVPWLKVLTVEDLLRRLTDDVLLSTVGSRDLPERQQTMNATVAWSYQLLNSDEQRAFRHFGALPGLFSIEAAAAVLAGREERAPAGRDDALHAAAGLMDKSLLLRSDTAAVPTRPLYYMLDTVRAYAARELAASGERDNALEGLVRYCTDEAALAAEGLVGLDQVQWLHRVREDLESYRAALTWLLDGGRAAEASHIAWSLFFFWAIRGHAAEGLGWYEQILNRPSLPPDVESRTLVGAAAMRYTQGDLRRARTALTRALSLAHETGDMVMIARAENLLGDIEHSVGNADAAREHFARSIEGFRALALPWGLGNSLTGMAAVDLATGDAAHAEHLLDEATSVLRHTAPWFVSWALYLRAFLAVRRRNPDEAIGFVRESLTYVRQLHDTFAFVYALVPLAAAAVLKGDDEWAARILGARDTVTERTGAAVAEQSLEELKTQAQRDAVARLGPDRWASSYAAGRNISIDALLKDIEVVVRKGRGSHHPRDPKASR